MKPNIKPGDMLQVCESCMMFSATTGNFPVTQLKAGEVIMIVSIDRNNNAVFLHNGVPYKFFMKFDVYATCIWLDEKRKHDYVFPED